jgi:CHAT domain-containing protein
MRFTHFSYAIISLFFLLYSFSILNAQNKSIKDPALQLQLGVTDFEEKKYSDAVLHLENAIIGFSNSDNPDLESADLTAFYLCEILIETGNFKEAIPYAQFNVEFSQEKQPFDHTDYIYNLWKLAMIYYSVEDFEKAKPLFDELYKLSKLHIDDTEDYVSVLKSSIKFYQSSLNFNKTRELKEELLVKYEKTEGHSIDYVVLLQELGWDSVMLKDYGKAKEYFAIAGIKSQNFGPEHYTLHITSYINLAKVWHEEGNNKKALMFYEYAKNLVKEKLGTDSIIYSQCLNNIAKINGALGNNSKAIDQFKLALEIHKNILGKNDSGVFRYSINLSKTYLSINDVANAKVHLKEAYNILKINDNLSEGYDYADYLDMSSRLLYEDKHYNEAIENLNKAVTILKSEKVLHSKKIYSILNNLATIYLETGELTKSIEQYEKILSDFELNIDSYDYSVIADNLFAGYSKLENYDKAIEYALKSNKAKLSQLNDVLEYRSEIDKKLFVEQIKYSFDVYQSAYIYSGSKSKSLIETNLNNQLILKGLVLNSTIRIISDLSQIEEPNIDSLIYQYRTENNNLIKLRNSRATLEIIDSLSNQVEEIELKLIQEHDRKFPGNKLFSRNWKHVQSQLKDNELAIEFSHFRYRNQEENTGKVLYVCYLFDNKSTYPKMIELFEEKELKSILVNKSPNQLYSTRGSKSKSTTTNIKTAVELYNLIWLPIENHLSNKSTIYFSVSGLLHQISFAALTSGENEILTKRFNLNQVSSTYLLVQNIVEPSQTNSLLMGGITYDFTPSNSENRVNTYSESLPLGNARSTRDFNTSWNYLPGTLEEIVNVKNLFDSKNFETKILSKDHATETNFKNLSGRSPSTIHIATHGFFFENPKQIDYEPNFLPIEKRIFEVAENPMLRSGLILYGANYAWHNGNNPYLEDDGILTALEISNLDLSQTDLVILSACETGLGDIDGSEGVYGLQRAFKKAGVKTIIMTLWEVPDKETSEFMTKFYNTWLGGETVREAFRKTQRKMAAKYQDSPDKWAAFTLLE